MSEPVVAAEFISAPLSWKKMANSLCEISGQGFMNWIFVLLKTTTMILTEGIFHSEDRWRTGDESFAEKEEYWFEYKRRQTGWIMGEDAKDICH